ncbi:MAG: tetraacyldisaccharide 4'-kinase [Alphaproteobacteria bacterium]|nr:tetraacyldisaccharide 4'-kinase [Alphaproteobacteria bacterium]
MFTTPSFWYRPPGSPSPAAERLLAPFSRLYALGRRAHAGLIRAKKSPVPVICIGNIVAGGSGKTPAALALLEIIRKAAPAARPFFLTRGYGGGLKGPLRVDPAHNFRDVGDEALLLAALAPTIVSADRVQGALQAAAEGADLIVMDDGLQNPALRKNLRIVVVDGRTGFGNGRLLPAGPLREPLAEGLGRADAFILIGEDLRGARALLPWGVPVFQADLRPAGADLPVQNTRYLAFCGLGVPDKFFTFLRSLGYELAGTRAFPDHHPYAETDMEALEQEARSLGARLVTTQKDFVRLPRKTVPPVQILPVRLVFQEEEALAGFLKEAGLYQ